jgi:hypothetical protein
MSRKITKSARLSLREKGDAVSSTLLTNMGQKQIQQSIMSTDIPQQPPDEQRKGNNLLQLAVDAIKSSGGTMAAAVFG